MSEGTSRKRQTENAVNVSRIEQDVQLVGSLLERQRLFEKLVSIEHSISHGAPLDEVLDSITRGASELFGGDIVGLRLIDEDDPNYCRIVSSFGVKVDLIDVLERTPVGEGAGGRAILEDRLVVVDDYQNDPVSLSAFVHEGLSAAMAAPVHDKGRVIGSLVVASYERDRTYSPSEQDALLAFARHASLALSDAKSLEAMREAQQAKEMFTAMVSHGLKTPLSAIMGLLFTLEKHHRSLDEPQRERMLRSARQRAEDIEQLINRLLQGARAELSATKLDVRLPALVEDAVRGFEERRSISTPDIPEVTMNVDADALYEAVGILVENAVAHSPDDSEIVVRAHVDGDEAAIAVQNVGRLPAGMDAEGIFQPFKRGQDVTSHGVGLGLYIAAQIAAAMGGRIEIASDEQTVTFSIRFPFSETD